MRENLQRYSAVAVVLHWAIALLILFNLSLGFFMEGFSPSLKGVVLQLHFSSGITVLGLTVLRVLWRLTHKPPPFAPGLSKLESFGAHFVHYLLYAGMVVMPLTGWAIISAHPYHPGAGFNAWWGLFHVGPIMPVANMAADAQKAAHGQLVEAHEIGGYIMVALLLAHVAGALKHQFYDRHAEFARMSFGRG